MSGDADEFLGRAPSLDEFRRAFGNWLTERWDEDMSLVEWRQLLVDHRWARPSWPQQWFGRRLTPEFDNIVLDELTKREIPGPPIAAGLRLAAPTILAHGSELLCQRLLRPILTGEETWCQLFSEPGAGSDLAGLTTSAVADGEEFVIDGQKLWSTSANHAEFGMLLARTDWNVPKHAGITYFALPMHQSGIEVRPLRQMNGKQSFNEVFISDARVSRDHIVGALGDGWRIAQTTLANERRLARQEPPASRSLPGRAWSEAQHELDEYQRIYDWYPQRGGRPDLVVEHARRRGVLDDPTVRQSIAHLIAVRRTAEWNVERFRHQNGGPPAAAHGSLAKLAASTIARLSAALHSQISGAHGMVVEDGLSEILAEIQVSVPAVSIAGGTDEVQRTIIGERLLDLPKEPSTVNSAPFRAIPRN